MSLRTPPRPSLLDKGPDSGRSMRLLLAALVVVIVGAGAAFFVLGGDDQEEVPDLGAPVTSMVTTTPAPTTVADPLEAKRAQVIAGYRAAWAAFEEAAGRPGGNANPDHPALVARMTGKELRQVQVQLQAMKDRGLVSDGARVDYKPRVVSIEGNSAKVQDCYTSYNHLVDARTGELRDTPGPVTRGAEATLLFEGGTWKMADLVTVASACS